MVSTTGGIRPGHDEERKKRLDEMVAEGYLFVEQPRLHIPDQPPLEPTYRLTEKGREFLAA
jgi:DNA-binding PadR family transcriptional regulator